MSPTPSEFKLVGLKSDIMLILGLYRLGKFIIETPQLLSYCFFIFTFIVTEKLLFLLSSLYYCEVALSTVFCLYFGLLTFETLLN